MLNYDMENKMEKIKTVEITFYDNPMIYVWSMDNEKTTIEEVIKFLQEHKNK